ncbi:hypothetical protein Tco_0902205 [Tanacetum coccineum]
MYRSWDAKKIANDMVTDIYNNCAAQIYECSHTRLHTSKGIWMARCAGIETFAIAKDLQDGLLPITGCIPYGGVQTQVVEQSDGLFNSLTISSKSNKVCGKRKLDTVYSNELSMGYLCVHLPALREPQSANEGGVTSADIQDEGYKGNLDLRLPVAGIGGQLLEVERGIFDVEGIGPDNVPMDGEDDPKDSSVTLELEVMDVKESYARWSRIRWKVKLKCKVRRIHFGSRRNLMTSAKRNDILLSSYAECLRVFTVADMASMFLRWYQKPYKFVHNAECETNGV